MKKRIKSYWNFNIRKLKKNKKSLDQPAIEVKNLTKKFGKFTAINKISFVVEKGHIHGFIGPNGAGKTTTIKIIISAIRFKKGTIFIGNFKNTAIEAKKKIGYIPELARFPKNVSVFEYLVAMGRVAGMKANIAKILAENFLKEQNLWSFRKKDPNSFSSGMKKKVLLNQALFNNPEILILDEPTANLDPSARIELFDYLKELRSQGKTIFISSHILSELQKIIDAVTILDHGKVIFSQSINKDKIIDYQIIANDNGKLLEILKARKFKVKKYDDYLIVTLPTFQEIKKMQNLAYRNDLIILSFQEQKIDLEAIYNSLVLHKTKEEKL